MPPVNGYECNNKAECGAIRRIEDQRSFPLQCENCESDDITPIVIQRLDADGD